jgi:microcin C transport system substrate-binding protein
VAQLKNMKQARARTPREVFIEISSKIKSKTQRNQILIFITQLPIFSKKFYTKNDFTKTTLTPPLGSGPYRIDKYKVGKFIRYKRNKNYWAIHLPVNKGRWNFDSLRFEYFRERNSEFEAFKSGAYHLREEYTSKVWVKQYDFPAVKEGRVKKLVLPDSTPSGAQGWFINMRRDKFKDIRVRKALNYAFDFEWTNRNQFYGLYKRTESFFENSLLKAQAAPSPAELVLLSPYRKNLPKEAFGQALVPPRSNGSGQDRANLLQAAQWLEQAGWKIVEGKRQKEGKTLTIEFMTDAPSFERIIQPFIKNLKLLGIEATLRIVDAAQYQQRLRTFDFDMTTRRFSISNTPGIELRGFFASSFVHTQGGRNLSGISHPAVDALVEKVINAKTRRQQITAAHGLDRALRSLYIWVPQWFNDKHHIAYWGKLRRPKTKPLYGRGILDSWWREE